MSAANLSAAQRAAADCRRPACVLAGAGSGKTQTLVEAITRRLEDRDAPEASRNPLDILDILALTFTDKAAAELRQRLALTFTDRRRRAEAEAQEETAAFWRMQSAHLDRADIGTIHSYALRLVRENALPLGLAAAPAMEQDEGQPARDLDDIFLDWMDEGSPELLALLKAYRPDILKEIMTLCAARLSAWGLDRLTADPPSAAEEPAASLATFIDLVRRTRAEVQAGAIKPNKTYYAAVSGALEALSARVDGPLPPDPDGLAAELPIWRGLLRGGGRWYTAQALKDRLAEALDHLEACLAQTLVQPLLHKTLALVNQIPARLDRAKARRGTINFDDILILARRLLASRPEVRRREISRRRLIFIDEFQDTSRLQVNMLAFLLLPADDETVYPEDADMWGRLDWTAVGPRFQAFGDLKQSIYRFRGAEVEVMGGFQAALAKGGGQVLALNHNYRSQAPLVDFFNTLFSARLSEFFSARDQQRSVRPALYPGPHVVRLHAAGIPARTAARRAEEEAALLVRYLDLLFRGRTGVLIPGENQAPRPPRPGEVALLFRRARYAAVFKAALLEAGWPARLGLGDNPFDFAEVRGLLAAFQFLSGLDQNLNLAAALRSPLGPVSDQTLLRLAWPAETQTHPVTLSGYFGPAAHPWPDGLASKDLETLIELRATLDRLAPLVGRLRPVEILERLVEERLLLPLAALEPDAADRILAVTTFLALSRQVGNGRQGRPLSVAEELAAWGRNWRGRSNPDLRPGEEAVTILTVHGAKGLEFPVVVIAEAELTTRPQARWAAVSGNGRLALNYRDAVGRRRLTSSFLRLSATEEKLERMENRRLLYVAATRARDHLVFLGRPKEKDDPGGERTPEKARGKNLRPPHDPGEATWLETLRTCPASAPLSKEIILEGADDPAPASSPARADWPRPAAPPPSTEEKVNLLAPMVLPGRSLSATALARLLAEDRWPWPENDWTEADEETGDEADGALAWPNGAAVSSVSGRLAPRDAGSLFHAVLEIIDPGEPYPRELLAAESGRLGLNPTVYELEALAAGIEKFLAGPLGQAWREAQTAGRPVFREWPFQLRLIEPGPTSKPPRQLDVSGQIDLFFETPTGGWLVDYKLAALPQGRRLAAYEHQIRLYTRALTGAGWTGPLRAWLYFAGGEAPVLAEVDLAGGCPSGFWLDFFQKFFSTANASHLRL